VERRVGPLERAALGLAETKDRTSRIESDVARLKAQFSDWCPKMNQDMTNLQQELAKLKD
jgi:uncharacterized protein YukE